MFLELIVVLALVGTLVVAPMVLLVLAYVRSRRVKELLDRVERLEVLVHGRATAGHAVGVPAEPLAAALAGGTEAGPGPGRGPGPALAPVGTVRKVAPEFDWEWFLGRRALGWVAVVLIVFAAAFFLKYAIENRWIGPLGRVALAAAAGLALAVGGRRYAAAGLAGRLADADRGRRGAALPGGLRRVRVLPPAPAGGRRPPFLVLIVVESMVLAVLYDAPALALVAVLGGLLTPVLMHSEHDQYASLFLYLAVLDAGVVLLAVVRPWPAVTTVALLGTQGLFWGWYAENYHPEKLGAAVGFQVVVFALFLGQGLVAQSCAAPRGRLGGPGALARERDARVRRAVRPAGPAHHVWMGTLALAAAAVYAEAGPPAAGRAAGRAAAVPDDPGHRGRASSRRPSRSRPTRRGSPWAGPPRRRRSGGSGSGSGLRSCARWRRCSPLMAVVRLVFVDTPYHTRAPFVPIFNRYALPALGVVACLLAAVAATRRLRAGLGTAERSLAAAVEVAGASAALAGPLGRLSRLLPCAGGGRRVERVRLGAARADVAVGPLGGLRDGRAGRRVPARAGPPALDGAGAVRPDGRQGVPARHGGAGRDLPDPGVPGPGGPAGRRRPGLSAPAARNRSPPATSGKGPNHDATRGRPARTPSRIRPPRRGPGPPAGRRDRAGRRGPGAG